jgi:K+-sensing histidine kinase KdpD
MKEKITKQEDKLNMQIIAKGESNIYSDPLYKQILSTISHELRTPMAVIKSNIGFINKFEYEMDASLKEECISLCNESVSQLEKFLENIQLLNNIQNSAIVPQLATFNVKEIIQQVFLRLSSVNLDYRRIKLHWDLKDTHIVSEKKYLNQIVFKLLSNALKFSKGNVKLSISTSNHQLIITVQDLGLGISEDELEKIFHPFYKAPNVKNIPGTGLGLTIVHSLVKILSGSIQISSEIAKGTTIQISIGYGLPNENSGN